MTDVPLRQHIDAIMDEQRRAHVVAEQEREKSARALRDELTRAIDAGDMALKEHVFQQIANVMAALESAEKLEVQRIGEVKAMVSGVQREIAIAFAAAEAANAEAKAANEKRFEGANEWRQQSADRERSQMEQMTALSATFLPREVADNQIGALAERVRTLEGGQTHQAGATEQQQRHSDNVRPWMLAATSTGTAIFLAVVIFVANLLTGSP